MNGSAMQRYARPEHKAAARQLGYALTLGDPAAWHGLSVVATARLARHERRALAWATLRALTPEDAETVVSAALGDPAGRVTAPPPSFEPDMGEASIWASSVTLEDLRVYALAAFCALPSADQSAFLAHVRGAA